MSALPLANVRILTLAEQYPGPYATMILADLGADVILVERPGSGDPSRRFSGLFASFNRNKRSVVLDLKSDQGRDDFLRLVDTADVVMEGFRPGVMARLGIGAEALRARKPSLIFVSISSFGQTGPRAGLAGHDLSVQAAAGMIDVPQGQEAGVVLPMLPLGDISSAMFAVIGVVTALFARTRSDKGATIDVSMLDSLVSWMTPFLVPPMNNLPIRTLPPLDPGYGLFATADGRQITLSIAGEDRMWSSLCTMVGLEQFAALNEEQRSARGREIEPHLRAAIARQPYDRFYKQLDDAGIAFGPVLKGSEVMADAQMAQRRMTVDCKNAEHAQTFIRQPLVFDDSVSSIDRPAPKLGQHTLEILGDPPPRAKT